MSQSNPAIDSSKMVRTVTTCELIDWVLNCGGWFPSLFRVLSGLQRVKVAPLAQFSPSSEPSAPAVSSQNRTSTSVVPPGGGGASASWGWRCHPDLLEVDFKKKEDT